MNASIYIETLESEAADPVDLVMLHGWAMHGGLMKGLAEKLSGEFRVHLVDMPGHGASQPGDADFELGHLATAIVDSIKNKINSRAIWLGWSLGGLVVMKIAEQFPQLVHKLILLSSTPAFVKSNDWPHAVEQQVFENFADDLQSDLKATITRFLSLQVRGADDSRQTLKRLREILFTRELANENRLQEGLDILKKTDLRKLLNNIKIPLLLLGGERDTLVPQTALQTLANNNHYIEASIINKAGHAPFLSHPEQCAKAITGFCHD